MSKKNILDLRVFRYLDQKQDKKSKQEKHFLQCRHAPAHIAKYHRPSYGPATQLGETLQTLGELLADMDSMTRNTVGSLLAELVKSPADRGTIAAMAEAMTQARKQA